MTDLCPKWLTVLILFSFVTVLPLRAQDQNNSEQDSESTSISKIESYEDLPVVPGSKQEDWYQIKIGNQWLGWIHSMKQQYRTVQGEQSQKRNITEYSYSGQISFQIIQKKLEDKLKEELFGEQADRPPRSVVRAAVEKRIQKIIGDMKQLVARTSFSQSIYRYDNGQLREARYAISSRVEEDFTMYLQPMMEDPNMLRVLIPNEVPEEVDRDSSLPVVNTPLAAELIANNNFEQTTRQFLFLAGTRSNPLLPGEVTVLGEEFVDVELGEKTVPCRRVRAQASMPDGRKEVEIWFVDREGTVRKIIRQGRKVGDQPEDQEGESGTDQDKLQVIWSTRDQALQGLQFVFARKGRRNPFEPAWTKRSQKKETAPTSEEITKPECEGYEQDQMLNKAKSLVNAAKQSKSLEGRDQRIERQSDITREFNLVKEKVFHCGDEEGREVIRDLAGRLQNLINVSSMILSIAREKVKFARQSFLNHEFDSIPVYRKEVSVWENRLPSDPSNRIKQQFDNLLQKLKNLEKRAEIQEAFLQNAPPVRGVIYTDNPTEETVEIGMKLFGENIGTSLNLEVPNTTAIAIIETVKKNKRIDMSRKPGETIEIEQLGEVKIDEVHRDGVIFNYKGELIRVPLVNPTEAPTGTVR